ncbi:MAG TPA: PEP-CTERM sorting domain-containing protein [Candidatus Acidoferrum sp.]|nr:PEP-CTERM sorting domain-containing protein [Candidatus Acidoferrum sp.]
MSKIFSVRLALSLFVIVAACFMLPRPAAADSTTVDVTATTTTGKTITGSYLLSTSGTTDSIGAWSFNLSALGLSNISGTSGSIFDVLSVDALGFTDTGVNGGTDLYFAVLNPSTSSSGDLGVLTWGTWNLSVISVDLTPTGPTATTPEPSSWLLFGLGIAALLAMMRFGQRLSLNAVQA